MSQKIDWPTLGFQMAQIPSVDTAVSIPGTFAKTYVGQSYTFTVEQDGRYILLGAQNFWQPNIATADLTTSLECTDGATDTTDSAFRVRGSSGAFYSVPFTATGTSVTVRRACRAYTAMTTTCSGLKMYLFRVG